MTRETLQEIGASLVEKDGDEFCRCVLSQANWACGNPLVVDGIRHIDIANRLKSIVSPSLFRLVAIILPQAARVARLKSRATYDSREQAIAETHSTENDVQQVLPCYADLVVDGTRGLDELSLEIARWVRSDGLTGTKPPDMR